MSSIKITHTDKEWRSMLTPEDYNVLREKGTERPNSGEYNKCTIDGLYRCKGCNTALYTSSTKFDSGCGWPAFWSEIPGTVTRITDRTHGMLRVEIVCSTCDGHLGHVFKGERYDNPIDERHCVNSRSLKLDTKADPAEIEKAYNLIMQVTKK